MLILSPLLPIFLFALLSERRNDVSFERSQTPLSTILENIYAKVLIVTI
jgi:hypothetical protein